MKTLNDKAREVVDHIRLGQAYGSNRLHKTAAEWFASVVYDYMMDKSYGVHIRVEHIDSVENWRYSSGLRFIFQAPSQAGEVVVWQHCISVQEVRSLLDPEAWAIALLRKWCEAYAHQAFIKQPVGGPVTASEALMRERRWKRSSIDELI